MQQVLAETGLQLDENEHVIVPHFGRTITTLQCLYPLGLRDIERTAWDFARRTGHLGPGDQFASINQLHQSGELKNAQYVLLLGIGAGFSWSSALLDREIAVILRGDRTPGQSPATDSPMGTASGSDPAITEETDKLTRARLSRRVRETAAVLAADGLRPGACVAYLGLNSSLFLEVMRAAAHGPGVRGELRVRGPNVTGGYWRVSSCQPWCSDSLRCSVCPAARSTGQPSAC